MSDKRLPFLKLSPEAKVGLFVFLGIALLVYMSLRLGGITIGKSKGYVVYTSFASAAGLDKNASVRVAGVEVGRVKGIALKDNKARIEIEIMPDVVIGRDFTAVLTAKGLLGEKYIELIPGSPAAPPLKPGEEITRTTAYADLDKLITLLSEVSMDVKSVTETLAKVLGTDEGEESLRNIINNMESVTGRLDRLIAKNDERVDSVMRNLDTFSSTLGKDAPEIAASLKEASRNLNIAILKTSENLNQLVAENRSGVKEGVENMRVASIKLQEAMDNLNAVTKAVGPDVKDTAHSISSIAKKIDSGEGTLGKLVNDAQLHGSLNKTIAGINSYIDKTQSFKTYLGFRSEYLISGSETKNYFSLKLQPNPDKYYLIEAVDDPRGKVSRSTEQVTTGGTTTTTTRIKTSDSFKLSAQMAKRFKNLVIRGGIIESAGGVGADYYAFGNRFRLAVEAFDFSRDDRAHLKAYGSLSLNRFFHLSAGYDDIISENGLESAYVGLGFEFEDDDIKYLLGSAPVSF